MADSPVEQQWHVMMDHATKLHRDGHYAEALPVARVALQLAEAAFGEHVGTAVTLQLVSSCHRQTGDYPAAVAQLTRALAILEQNLGDHPATAFCLSGLAGLSRVLAQYSDGECYYLRAIAILEHVIGADAPDTAVVVDNLALLYQELGEYARAEPMHLRALAIFERVLGPEHPSTGTCLNNLAQLYQAQSRHKEVTPLLERSVAIAERSLGPNHPTLAIALDNLASALAREGLYARAEPIAIRALDLFEGTLGPGHRETGIAASNLADIYKQQGLYDKAEALLARSVAIAERLLGIAHPATNSLLSDQAGLYMQRGRYEEAEALYNRAHLGLEQTLGPHHPETAKAISRLGELHRRRGDFARAEMLTQTALRLKEERLGPDHVSVATSLNTLGVIYQEQHAHGRAAEVYSRALDIFQRKVGGAHPDVAATMSNLAQVFSALQDYERAEALIREALSIRRRTLGDAHPSVAVTLNNLAVLCQEKGRLEEGESLLVEVLTITQKALGPAHPDNGRALNNLAALFHARGEHQRAEEMYRRALEIQEASLGADHPHTMETLQNLTVNLVESGTEEDLARSLPLARRELESSRSRHMIAFGKERERRSLVSDRLGLFSLMASRLPTEPVLRREWLRVMFSAVVLGKARTVDELRATLEAAAQGGSEQRDLVARLRGIEAELSVLHHEGPTTDPSSYTRRLDALHRQEEDLLDALSRASASVRELTRESDISLDDLTASLNDGEAIVEIVRYFSRQAHKAGPHATGEAFYGALALTAHGGEGHVHWIPLEAATAVDELVARYRIAVRLDSGDVKSEPVKRAIRAAVWEPIARALDGTPRYFLALDGMLQLFPWRVLLAAEDDAPEIVQVTSSRDLRHWRRTDTSTDRDVIVGASRFGPLKPVRDFGFRDLPGVKVELAVLRRLFAIADDDAPDDLTKEWLLSCVVRPRILHIATHGYFRSNEEEEDPMLAAGIAMADANVLEHDGVLTAKEAVALNLRGTQLVTLSACETGVGVTNFSDGVVGLQRSLVVAGARAVLLSLWPVHDQKTTQFMEAFYGHLLEGLSKTRALVKTQRSFEQRGEPPSIWAPFVLVGDPAPLTTQ